jgi:hypothetical protein
MWMAWMLNHDYVVSQKWIIFIILMHNMLQSMFYISTKSIILDNNSLLFLIAYNNNLFETSKKSRVKIQWEFCWYDIKICRGPHMNFKIKFEEKDC